MGTDIHMIAQKKNNDEWKYLPESKNILDIDRNYMLFAILANVRNGYGVAGVDTGDAVEPIAMPRGLPDDWESIKADGADDIYIKENGEIFHLYSEPEPTGNKADSLYGMMDKCTWMGEHSHSWLILKELVEHNWQTPVILRGVVNIEEYKEFKKKGYPTSFCGGVWGKQIKHIDNAAMEILIDNKDSSGNLDKYYTAVEWKTTQYDRCKSFINSIEKLKSLSDEQDYSDIRVVFGFDS